MKTRTIEKIREQSKKADKKYRVNMKKDGGITSHEIDRALAAAFMGAVQDWEMMNPGKPTFAMPTILRTIMDEAITELNALSRQRKPDGFLPDNRRRIDQKFGRKSKK